MTGPQALALGRIRKDAGGSDFQRMRRQQDLLVAVREAILANGAEADPLGWLGRVPAIRTNLSPDQLVAAAAILARVPAERFYSRLVQPFGRGGTELYDERGYVLSANMDEIRDAAGLLFTAPGDRVTTGRQDPLARQACDGRGPAPLQRLLRALAFLDVAGPTDVGRWD